MQVLVLIAAVLVLLSACGPSPEVCERPRPLVDHAAWSPVDPEADPFEPEPGPVYPCSEAEMGAELLGSEESFTVVTGSCNWATVAQPLVEDVEAGEPVRVRVYWFSQRDFYAATAILGVALGDDIVLEHRVPIPSEGELLDVDVIAPRDYPAGTPVCFHVGNHGANSWNLLEVSVVREETCG